MLMVTRFGLFADQSARVRGVPAGVGDACLRSGRGGTGIYATGLEGEGTTGQVRTDKTGTRLRARWAGGW